MRIGGHGQLTICPNAMDESFYRFSVRGIKPEERKAHAYKEKAKRMSALAYG